MKTGKIIKIIECPEKPEKPKRVDRELVPKRKEAPVEQPVRVQP